MNISRSRFWTAPLAWIFWAVAGLGIGALHGQDPADLQFEVTSNADEVGIELSWVLPADTEQVTVLRRPPGESDAETTLVSGPDLTRYRDYDVPGQSSVEYRLQVNLEDGSTLTSDWTEGASAVVGWEWSAPLTPGTPDMDGPVVLSDDAVVLTQPAGAGQVRELVCYNADGTLRWRIPLGMGQSRSMPSVDLNDVIHVLENSPQGAQLLRVAADGEVQSRTLIQGQTPAPVVMQGVLAVDPAGNTFLLGSGLMAYVLADGTLAWSHPALPGLMEVAPAILSDGQLLVHYPNHVTRLLADGRAARLDAMMNRPSVRRWPFTVGVGDRLIHTRTTGLIEIWDATGESLIRTNFPPSGPMQPRFRGTMAARRDGTLYGLTDGGLSVWNEALELEWTVAYPPGPPPVMLGPGVGVFPDRLVPTVDGEGNVLVSHGDRLWWIGHEGETLRTTQLGHPTLSNPILSPTGRVYLLTGGHLHAFTGLAGLDLEDPWPLERRDHRGSHCLPVAMPPLQPPAVAQSRPAINGWHLDLQPGLVPEQFEILRSDQASLETATRVGVLESPALHWVDDSVAPGESYYYWVRAMRDGSTGPASDLIAVQTGPERILWRHSLPAGRAELPAVNPWGEVVVASRADSWIQMIHPDGDLLWEENLQTPDVPSSIAKPPVIDLDGTVYVLTRAAVHALNRSGERLWEVPLLQPGVAAADLVPMAKTRGGPLLISLDPHTLAALSDEGNIVWDLDLEQDLKAGPIVLQDGTILVLTTAELVLVDAQGDVVSRIEHGLATPSWMVPYGENSVLVLANHAGARVDVGTGEVDEVPFSGIVHSSPLMSPDGELWVPLRTSNQSPVTLWQFDGSSEWVAVSEEGLQAQVSGRDGGVIGFRSWLNNWDVVGLRPDGSTQWEWLDTNWPMNVGLGTGAPAELAAEFDGRVYVHGRGELVCLQIESAPARTAWSTDRGSNRRAATLEPASVELSVSVALNTEDPAPSAAGNVVIRVGKESQAGSILWGTRDFKNWERFSYLPPGSAEVQWEFAAEDANLWFQVEAP